MSALVREALLATAAAAVACVAAPGMVALAIGVGRRLMHRKAGDAIVGMSIGAW
jgi:hypothetical protein